MDKEASPIYELKQTLRYMLNSQDTEFFRNEEEFLWALRLYKIHEGSYILAEMELIGCILSLLSIILPYICILASGESFT